MVMRIIWMEFYMGKNAYLKEPWFQLDFAIVMLGESTPLTVTLASPGHLWCAGLTTLCSQGWLSLIDGFPNFKSFRGFRALRAVKGIRALSYCNAVLEALFEVPRVLLCCDASACCVARRCHCSQMWHW